MSKINKRNILVAFLLMLAATIWAAAPTWSVNPSNYTYNMTITGVMYINSSESNDANDMIAAFNGNNCIGVANSVYNADFDRYFYYLMIYSNTASQTVTFKIYDASADMIINVEESLQFVIDGIIGQIDEPWVMSENILGVSSEFLNFSIPGEKDEAVISENEIAVLMPPSTNLTNLVPEFTLDLYATARVNGIVQRSGLSNQDFTNPVIYEITGVNSSGTSVYTVNVFANELANFSAYNVFTPNNDGKNDVWKIQNHEVYRNCTFYMYYSTGKLIWSSIGYNNDWDGKTVTGSNLPSDTYYYVVECDECPDCKIKGFVTLLR